MTALAHKRLTAVKPGTQVRTWQRLVLSGEIIFDGAVTALDPVSGKWVEAKANPRLVAHGIARCADSFDNSAGTNTAEMLVDSGTYLMIASGLVDADEGKTVFVVDDQTFSLSSAGGTRPIMGKLAEVVDATHGYIDIEPPSAHVNAASGVPLVRGVVYNDQADLTAFTVASDEGLTYTEGQTLALVGQTTGAECGPYVVGAVAAGVAALSRPAWWYAAMSIRNGFTFEVSEGTWFAGSSWKSMTTGAKVVDTDDPLFYPRNFRQTVTLAAGVYTIGVGSSATPDEPLFLFSTTRSMVTALRNTADTCTATTGGYGAPVASRIAGKRGTAAVLVQAQVAAGTLNNADISTVDVLITNW